MGDGGWGVGRRQGNPGWGNPLIDEDDGWGHPMTGEEIIRDIVDMMVNDILRQDEKRQVEAARAARAVVKAVTAEMLRSVMPPHRSPLFQAVFLGRFIVDLKGGYIDPRQIGARTAGSPSLENLVQELEDELMEFTVLHIRFDSYANDAPTGGLYKISHDAYAYPGYHHRGETGRRSLVTHWRYGTLELTALPGLHVEGRARPVDDPDWVQFDGDTPANSGRGRPLPEMGEGTDGLHQHAEFWFAVEQSWDPLPEAADDFLLREAVFAAWETVNSDRREEWLHSHFEYQVDRHYERHRELCDALRLAQAYQRLAVTRAVEHAVTELRVVVPYTETGLPELVLHLGTEPDSPLCNSYSQASAESLVARCAADPCRQATFDEVDVAQARVDRQNAQEEEVRRNLACAARAHRRWQEMRDGPPPAKLARKGHLLRIGEQPGSVVRGVAAPSHSNLRQFLAEDSPA